MIFKKVFLKVEKIEMSYVEQIAGLLKNLETLEKPEN